MFQPAQIKGRKPKPSWFDIELQRNNGNTETLITAMGDDKLYKDATRIFKDLMHRNINLEVYGQYFNDTRLMYNLYNKAYDRYMYHTTICNAVSHYHNYHLNAAPNDVDSLNYEITVANNSQRLANAYSLICESLNLVKETKNPSYLYALSDKLAPYRTELQNE